MSEFLLLGRRPPAGHEVSLPSTAHGTITLTAWHRSLRRWGILRSFAFSDELADDMRIYLLVRASGHDAAWRLASRWERLSGCQVTVLGLTAAAAGEGLGR